MKKSYLLILFPIFLVYFFILSYETDEVKIYKQLQDVDSAISIANQSLANTLSSLQQSFEDLIEIGITFTEDQDINQNFDQFHLALENSNHLAQRLTHLFELDVMTELEEIPQQASISLKEIIEHENLRIQKLKDLLNSLDQINTQLIDMDTTFYNKKNNEVFNYIKTVREYFNQIQEDYIQYSQLVTEYMNQKSNLYSQIKS